MLLMPTQGKRNGNSKQRADVDSSPAVANGVVYFGSWDHERTLLSQYRTREMEIQEEQQVFKER